LYSDQGRSTLFFLRSPEANTKNDRAGETGYPNLYFMIPVYKETEALGDDVTSKQRQICNQSLIS
jgi:hypothetical protein